MGRDTAGVRAMHLSEGDRLVDMLVVDNTKDILTVTSKGYGKRSSLDDYRVQGRAGKGIKASILTEQTGNLVCLKQVTDEDDVMIITDSGIIIRMHCSDISIIGRNTRGVRLMRIKEGEVATIAVTERSDEEEVTAPDEVATAEQTSEEGLDETQDTATEQTPDNDLQDSTSTENGVEEDVDSSDDEVEEGEEEKDLDDVLNDEEKDDDNL
jgi:DNA gyrase subunit A